MTEQHFIACTFPHPHFLTFRFWHKVSLHSAGYRTHCVIQVALNLWQDYCFSLPSVAITRMSHLTWLVHVFFIHSYDGGHLGCLYDLATVSSAVMVINASGNNTCWFIFLLVCPGLGQLCCSRSIYNCVKNAMCISMVATLIYILRSRI